MNAAYFVRLCCLSLAVLFLMQLALSLLVRSLLPEIQRRAEAMEARRAARLFLALRWLPAIVGSLVVVTVCVPSYLRLEPIVGVEEEVGVLCTLLAIACLVSILVPIARVTYNVVRTEVRLRNCPDRICILEDDSTRMALAGIFEWRLLVSRNVMTALTEEEMAVALRHEEAHQQFRDNFARALVESAPWSPFGMEVRRQWTRFTEWAADDWAVAQDAGQSTSLASALVNVARLGSRGGSAVAASALISGEPNELRERVERLLDRNGGGPRRTRLPLTIVFVVGAFLMVGFLIEPAVIHRYLEILVG